MTSNYLNSTPRNLPSPPDDYIDNTRSSSLYPGGGNGITGSRLSLFTFGLESRSYRTGTDNLIYSSNSSAGPMGRKWGTGIGGAYLTYSFSTPSSTYISNGSPGSVLDLSIEQKNTARSVMQKFSSIANLTFTEVSDTPSSAGDIRWARSDNRSAVPTAYAYYPSQSALGGDIWIGNTYSEHLNPILGSYSYQTFLHELGHALGLAHPHESAIPAVAYEDQLKYSAMSYRSYNGEPLTGYSTHYYPTSLMLNDIAAIQYLYGVNTSYQAGNNTYSWAANTSIFETLYDAGGTDTIDASNQTQGVLINLTPGEWSQIGKAFWNGQSDVRDCLTIAYGCTIENATGSNYNDTLFGNSANNILDGRYGDDTYYIDSENDKIIEIANGDYDTIISTAARTYMPDEVEVLRQSSGGIYMNGNNTGNLIYGNTSNNEIWGRQGDDNISGGAGNDTIYGNPGNDTLYGGIGNDIISGGVGNDFLNDRDGADTYTDFFRGFGIDRIYEAEESTPGSIDKVIFTSPNGNTAVYNDQLWFKRIGNDLEISIIGSQNDSRLSIDNWYGNKANQVEVFYTEANGKTLLSSKVDFLVNAMAAFSPPAQGQYSLPQTYQDALAPVIASCWS